MGEWRDSIREENGVKVHLDLSWNQISDISPLLENVGLGDGDGVNIKGNPLNDKSYNSLIPKLKEKGVNLLFDVRGILVVSVVGEASITEAASDRAFCRSHPWR